MPSERLEWCFSSTRKRGAWLIVSAKKRTFGHLLVIRNANTLRWEVERYADFVLFISCRTWKWCKCRSARGISPEGLTKRGACWNRSESNTDFTDHFILPLTFGITTDSSFCYEMILVDRLTIFLWANFSQSFCRFQENGLPTSWKIRRLVCNELNLINF